MFTAGAQVVEKGDKMTVAFTAPSTFVRTYQNVASLKGTTSQTVGTSTVNVPSENAVKTAIGGLIKRIGDIVIAENVSRGSVIFTSDDVTEGELIKYSLLVNTAVGYIALLDSEDSEISYHGKGSSAQPNGLYEGSFSIPSGFSSAKVIVSGVLDYIHANYVSGEASIVLRMTDAESDINAIETNIDNIELFNSSISSKFGYLYDTKDIPKNTVVLTLDNVNVGDIVDYILTAKGSLGYIELYDINGDFISYFGKSNSGTSTYTYTGSFEIPSNFVNAKIIGNADVTTTLSVNSLLKKSDICGGERILIKASHDWMHVDTLRYFAFTSGIMYNGKEVHATRIGQIHLSDYQNSVIVFHEITEDGKIKVIYPNLDYDSLVGDLRDPNLSICGDYLLLSCFSLNASNTTAGNYLFILDKDYALVATMSLAFQGEVWGNTLITPDGYVLKSSYNAAGDIFIYKSNEVFNTTSLTFTIVKTFSVAGTFIVCNEPTMCYTNNKLVLISRTANVVHSVISSTSVLDGSSGWSNLQEIGLAVHSPVVPCYNDSNIITFAGSQFMPAYKRPPCVCVYDVDNGILLAHGIVDTLIETSGGYPSFIPLGGERYAMLYYEDYNNTAVYSFGYYRRVNLNYILGNYKK